MKLSGLLVICLFLISLFAVDAREKPIVTYQEMFEKSDLVIIAKPTAIADTAEKIDFPGIISVHNDGRRTGLPVTGVETKLRVIAVLKGEKSIKEVLLHHYRVAEDELDADGLAFVTFDPKKPNPFLLFLVREKDGRSAPFDQTDPAWQAVQKLETYSD